MRIEKRVLYIPGCPGLTLYWTKKADRKWRPVWGITNTCRTPRGTYYTWYVDVDGDCFAAMPSFLHRDDFWLIVESSPGRCHVYLDVWEPTFQRALKRAYWWYKSGVGDRGHLMMARVRWRAGDPRLNVIRVGGKHAVRPAVLWVGRPRSVPHLFVARVLRLLNI